MTDDDVITQPEPVSVSFEDVLSRVSEMHAKENARLVAQLAMSQEECATLRRQLTAARQVRAAASDGQPS